MKSPPKYNPVKSTPPIATSSELVAAVAVFAEEKRLNPVLLQRRMGVTLVRASQLIEQMVKLIQERA